MSLDGPAFTRMETDARRRQLIEVAGAEFARSPYEQVSVEEIADAAGVSRGLLYHYFPGKRALYVEVVRSGVVALLDAMTPTEPLDAAEELRFALDGYVTHAVGRRYPFQTVVQTGAATDPEVDAIVEGIRRTLVDRILTGLPTASRRRLAMSLAVRGWIGYVESLTVGWLAQPDVDRATLVELLARPLASILLEAASLARH